MRKRLIGVAALGLGLLGPGIGAARAPVAVESGRLLGVADAGAEAFFGVPYAAAPVGPLRWRAPRPPTSWPGVRIARHPSPACMQRRPLQERQPWTHEYLIQGEVSEDCLALNVWRPMGGRAKHLPVLVFLHGGGFTEGAGDLPIYSGAALARDGVVVVTLNYRLGVFGFLAREDLTGEARAAGGPAANWGLQDMVFALGWVHRNIKAFGGDPDAVTVAGQSAGALAVHALLHAPAATSLFKRAVAESGLPGLSRPKPLGVAERAGQELGEALGAKSIGELRALPADRILADAPRLLSFGLVIDASLLADPPRALGPKPLLIGFNRDEASAMSPIYGRGDAHALSVALKGAFGPMADAFAPAYGGSTDQERALSLRALYTDKSRIALLSWSLEPPTGSGPVYAYLFDHAEPGPMSARYGAFHSAEIPYLYRTLKAAPERGFSTRDEEISRRASSALLRFVKTGDPRGADLPVWPAFTPDDPMIVRLGDTFAPEPLLAEPQLAGVRKLLDQGFRPSVF